MTSKMDDHKEPSAYHGNGHTQPYELQEHPKSHVPAKYHGTEGDRLQMKVLGRTQETKRVFTFLSILGFGSTLMVTWEVILANLGAILTNGGTAGMFWGFLLVAVGYTFVYASLSEMASMAPTSGGQYREYLALHEGLSSEDKN